MTTQYYERIREIREDRGLSQTAVARLLHIGQRTYSDYETGKTRIPLESVIILAKYYNLSMDYITGVSNVAAEFPRKWTDCSLLLHSEKKLATQARDSSFYTLFLEYQAYSSVYLHTPVVRTEKPA